MRIILLGPPGGGKGTEGKLLAQDLDLKRLSVGAVLRKKIKEDPASSEEIRNIVAKGLNVPGELLYSVLSKWLDENKNDFVIDNFPRSIPQLNVFKKLYVQGRIKIDKVFHLFVSEETSLKRLLERKEERQKKREERIDETVEVIRKRYRTGYIRDIPVILEYFQNLGILEEIDAEKSVEEVHQDVLGRLI